MPDPPPAKMDGSRCAASVDFPDEIDLKELLLYPKVKFTGLTHNFPVDPAV